MVFSIFFFEDVCKIWVLWLLCLRHRDPSGYLAYFGDPGPYTNPPTPVRAFMITGQAESSLHRPDYEAVCWEWFGCLQEAA